jgi:DNA-binding response OmpR family regulator
MNKFKILHVEHDERYGKYVVYELGKNGYEVDTIESPDVIEEKMIENNYDLILTDVKWPVNNEDEDESKERLSEVVENVRKRDSLIPIVALSTQEDSHEIAVKFQDEIFDIWAKASGYPQFLVYRVNNLIRNQQNLLNEEVLIREAKRVISENPDAWQKEEVLKICNDMLRIQGLGFMLQRIGKFYVEISFKIGFTTEFIEKTFQNFYKAEPVDLARKQRSWGHVRHSFSIFLAGYILFNERNCLINMQEIVEKMELVNASQINEIWFVASAFHDIATYYEHIPEVIKLLKEVCPDQRDSGIKINLSNKKNFTFKEIENLTMQYHEADLFEVKNILCSIKKNHLNDKVEQYMNEKVDHGIISAIELAGQRHNIKVNAKVLNFACYIIIIHNCFGSLNYRFNGEDEKLLQLFCILDNLQAWARENQYEGIINYNSFKSVVLRKFNQSFSNKDLKIKIDYIPFRFASPKDSQLKINEEELKSVLRKTIEKLSKMNFEYSEGKLSWNKICFSLEFCINGRKLKVYDRV